MIRSFHFTQLNRICNHDRRLAAKPRYNIPDQIDQGNLDGKLIPSDINDVLAGCPVPPSRFHFVIPLQLVLTSARPKPDG